MEMIGTTYSTAHYEAYKSNNNSNIFEEIVESMILDEVSGMNDSFKRAISSLSKREKRMAILSLLDKDRNLFKNIKSQITDNKISKIDHLKDVIYKIREYVKVGEVEQKKYGEVMSPLDAVVKPMINEIEEEFWTNPDNKILDNCNGTGPFPLLAIWKLMNGLKDWEPDEDKRYRHIVENMIYVAELQPKNQFIWMCIVDPYDEYKLNLYTGSFLDSGFDRHMKEVWGVKRFSLILGNPPYQEELKTKKGSAKPLYNLFTEKSIKISDKVLYITPSRWFAGGKGLDNFRKMMMESNKIRYIRHFDDATELFGNSVEIKGGVSYFLFDKEYNGLCLYNESLIELSKYDVLVDSKYYSIIEKVLKYNSLESIMKGQSYSGITTNDIRLTKDRISESQIKCYVSKQKGFINFIEKDYIKKSVNISNWKVISAESAGSTGNLSCFGNIFVGKPGEICNQSYNVFIVDKEEEANSLVSFLKTNFAQKMLGLRKISQHIKPDTCKWIPILPLDTIWDDSKIFEYLNLTENEKNIFLF